MTARLAFETPLGASRRPAALSGTAHLTGLEAPRVVRDLPLSEGDAELSLREGRLEARGTARLAGTPIEASWTEDALASAGSARRLTIRGRRRHGGPAAPRIRSHALARRAGGRRGEPGHVPWHRRRRRRGTDRRRPPRDGRGTALEARRRARPGEGTAHARRRRRDGRAAADLRGGADARDGDGDAFEGRRGLGDGPTRSADRRGPGGAGRCIVTLAPQANGHRLHVESHDAGALVRAIAGDDRLRGGRLVLEGTVAGSGADLDASGVLDVRDVVVARSPVLARIATLVSLAGVQSAFAGSGLPFERIGATLHFREPTLTIRDGRARLGARRRRRRHDRPPSATRRHARHRRPVVLRAQHRPGPHPRAGRPRRAAAMRRPSRRSTSRVRARSPSRTCSVEPMSAIAPGVLRDVLRKIRR